MNIKLKPNNINKMLTTGHDPELIEMRLGFNPFKEKEEMMNSRV